MKPRITDWALAGGVGAAFATGLWTLLSGRAELWWVFALHGMAGYAVALLLVPKLWRVRRRLAPGLLLKRAWAGLASTLLALAVVGTGVAWAGGARFVALGYNALNWHILAGIALTAIVSLHMLLRAKPLRRADVRDRRQALHVGARLLGAIIAWPAQQRLIERWRLPGALRRFTGSREAVSFAGNAFPATSWVADDPAPLDPSLWHLQVRGLVRRPLALPFATVDAGEMLTATLDCTGGFFSTQHWRGARVGALLDQAGALPAARWVRFVSVTGYRWSLPIDQARDALVATHVGDEPLSHGHGAPARLVVPGERGFIWVKWLVAIELRATPDPDQLLAINLSGFGGWSQNLERRA